MEERVIRKLRPLTKSATGNSWIGAAKGIFIVVTGLGLLMETFGCQADGGSSSNSSYSNWHEDSYIKPGTYRDLGHPIRSGRGNYR